MTVGRCMKGTTPTHPMQSDNAENRSRKSDPHDIDSGGKTYKVLEKKEDKSVPPFLSVNKLVCLHWKIACGVARRWF